MKSKLSLVVITILSILTFSCSSIKPTIDEDQRTHPTIDREFRAAWVATVANINWPSEPGIPVYQQKQEAIELLDLLKNTNFNAVIFQVRPQADALYKSDLEPWSYYLTGQQGEAPEPFYDPLEFWVDEAHKRGLELHVWLNPYRAHHPNGAEVTSSSIVNTKPELALELKGGYWWLDPSKKGTQDHSLSVVMDIVTRYDIDGVHFDDYFYPYPSYNGDEDFPDYESRAEYVKNGGTLSVGDWRRESVNTFIKKVYESIKAEKKHVKFGLSPFGIWRPGHPNSVEGFDQYDVLYADAKKWINEGWVDYFTPQLYWPINQIPQSFPVLLGWWNQQNLKDRNIWPGISMGRLQGEAQLDEVVNDIMITRGMNPKSPGIVHWSIAPLVNSDTLQQVLREQPYAKKALVPAMKHLSTNTPPAPQVHCSDVIDDVFDITIQPPNSDISNWIVYTKYDDNWSYKVNNRSILTTSIPLTKFSSYSLVGEVETPKLETLTGIQVTYLDRYGNESEPYNYTCFNMDTFE